MPKPTVPTINPNWKFTSEGIPEFSYVWAVHHIDGCQDTVEIELGGCVSEYFGDVYIAWAPIPKPALPVRESSPTL